jgi:hypothetical protein
MDPSIPAKPAVNAAPVYPSYPAANQSLPEPDSSWLSARFVIFSILVIGAAVIGGSLKSGRLNLDATIKAAPQTKAPAAPVAPVAPLKPDAFVVTSISLGQPSFAIINGKSRTVGDPVEAPGATGWKVKQIIDGAVWLQNGAALASLPLSTPGIKPLDDQLHPLN